MRTKPRDAFDMCLEIYRAARELVDERTPTSRLASPSKFLWRPDLHPRLVEYVSDFALAGERALRCADEEPEVSSSRLKVTTFAGKVPNLLKNFRPPRRRPRLASRLILFRTHYLGGAEYHAARRLLGVSEVNCADWVDEIKELVGRELLRSGIFPPGRYFREMTKARTAKRRRDSSTARSDAEIAKDAIPA